MSSTSESTSPLPLLVQSLRAEKLDFLLQGIADEFQGEYTPACAQRLPFLTGFTGSAGLGAFRADKGKHVLFVDGRYTLQAKNEVDAEAIEVINSGDVTLAEWLKTAVGKAAAIGFDPWLVTAQQLAGWKKATAELPLEWRAVSPNLVDGIWKDRPAPPEGEAHLQDVALSGASYEEKRAVLLEVMQKYHADALVISQPDSINWLLNIRGSDISYNPLLLCYFVLRSSGLSAIYSYERSFNSDVNKYWKANKVERQDILHVFGGKDPLFTAKARVMIDPTAAASGWWQRAEKEGWKIIEADDPTLLAKACKNSVELETIRSAHRRDGLALSRFLGWFDKRAAAGNYPEELEVVDKLEESRKQDNGYQGPSFATIAGSGPHGAIVHYRASAESNRRAQVGELFLLDSGGQYDGATTDVTRTIFVAPPKGGKPSHEVRDHVTRVLKGHIALASARFPEGTTGSQLDVLARSYLWQTGLDYDHGTGHGVGAGLCVHEGPQRISKRASAVALQPGMILSNEPGYYAEGKYGIRIENLVVVVKVGTTAQGKALLGFETLTMAPIDTRLVDVAMLSSAERNWLNDYHQRVYKTHIEQMDDAGRKWLTEATRAI